MPILQEHVERYLNELRPQRAPVMAEMEELAARDGVPIVHWETGRLLAAICRAMDPVVLEVGTAIGYSTLHMAEQLQLGRVVTLERDTARADQARDFFARAGVADRVELVEGDARETIPALEGPFDLLFVDATIDGQGGRSIQADRVHVGGAVRLIHQFRSQGEIRLIGARIDGSLDLTGARIESSDGPAIGSQPRKEVS